MEDSFDLLEGKVRMAADLVRRLRQENHKLEEDLDATRGRLEQAEQQLEELKADLA